VIWLGVPILDWLILAIALGLGIEAWLTTRLTPEEREAARREAEGATPGTSAPSATPADDSPGTGPREDQDHAQN
jgi:hypothetical protein